MKTIGIIPARGGSKGIPKKNIRNFCGKPLIAWSILSALESDLDRVIVCTDGPEIAKVAKKYGAEVIQEPDELAVGTMGVEPAMIHVYKQLEKEGYKADAIVTLMATNPIRQSFHINESLKIFKNTKTDSVVSVNETPANHTPYWTLIQSPAGKVSLWGGIPLKDIHTRRQDFPQKCYARNDLIYVLKPEVLIKGRQKDGRIDRYGKKTELYITDPSYEIDINTLEEWGDAEIRFKRMMKAKK